MNDICSLVKEFVMRPILKFFTIGALAALLGSAAFCQHGRAAQAPSPEQAYQQLLSVGRFAFGGVGYAGTTSEGEIAYRAIAASTNALQLFSAALTNGNPQAKLYALCGIRGIAPREFAEHARVVMDSTPQVQTMQGCIVDREATSNVVARIASGSYDLYIKRQ